MKSRSSRRRSKTRSLSVKRIPSSPKLSRRQMSRQRVSRLQRSANKYPMMHTLSIREPWVSAIAMGLKRYEGRPNIGLVRKIKVGDTLRITGLKSGVSFTKTIVGKYDFSTFREMIEQCGLRHILPGVSSIDKGVKLYRSFPNYTKKESLYGVVAIELQ